MGKHNWAFKRHFRGEAYGWKGTATASKRMREAVSEIKKIARKDSSLAGEGVVELFVRLYPALMNIDGSSGALGTAMNRTIDALRPILIQADWNMNTRGRWLDKLYAAIQEDGWGTFDELRDYWGELCVYPDLAHLWADRLIPTVKEVFTSVEYSFSVDTDLCLSCLLYTDRFDELQDLLQLRDKPFWPYNKFWAMALVKQDKREEALAYAEHIQSQSTTNNSEIEIDEFCESVLIQIGRIDEAYEKYGLNLPPNGTYLNIYRGICKKYSSLDKRKILLDCIEKSGDQGKWFASAKTAGFLDIALQCAQSRQAQPSTLTRAVDEYADTNPEFSVKVGICAILTLLTESFYDPIQPVHVKMYYMHARSVARNHGLETMFHSELDVQFQECFDLCDMELRNVLSELIQMEITA